MRAGPIRRSGQSSTRRSHADARRSIARSTSSTDEFQPRLSRTHPRARSSSKSIAASVADRVVVPLWQADPVDAQISGSGDLSLELEARSVIARISGSGGIAMSGRTESLETRISGSGGLSAFDLETGNASIRISGSGSCKVHVKDELDVHISGSGSVDYKGNPKVNVSGSGSGSVQSK